MSELVTIGIPFHRKNDGLRSAIESALDQTYDDIEVLLVDDGSTDRADALVKDIGARHPRGNRLRLLTQPRRQGVSAARNRIIDEARGLYLYYMDSDDRIEPDTIRLLHGQAQGQSAEVVFGSYEKVTPSGEVFEPYVYEENIFRSPGELATYAYRRYGGIQSSACNMLLRMDWLRATGVRFIDADYWEDMAFVHDLLPHVARAVMLPTVTYHYVCRPGSLSHYEERTAIPKDEIMHNAAVIRHLKRQTRQLGTQPYTRRRRLFLLKTDYYLAVYALRHWRNIRPRMGLRDYLSFFTIS